MTLYQNFFGIDIGKFYFVVSLFGAKSTREYQNNASGIAEFIQEHSSTLSNALCILETTGGYELDILYTLIDRGYSVHRADTRKVKGFIRSFGNSAKTDALDAKALSHYAFERHDKLELFKPLSKDDIRLFQLVQRRKDINHMLVSEKNRLQSQSVVEVIASVNEVIKLLKHQLQIITSEIQLRIKSNPVLQSKQEILKSVPGIGEIVSAELLVLLPELGSICRRKIASLAGVAPRANESGKFVGYRRTIGGREGVKRILFMAAMAARRSHSPLKEFYEKLIAKGKKKMVALTALMRKILVIANARIKSSILYQKHS